MFSKMTLFLVTALSKWLGLLDLLADEVAIIRKGELAALGSPLQLKTDHGSALQFSILVNKEKLEEATAYIKKFFKDASDSVDIQASDTGNIVVKIASLKQKGKETGVDPSKLPAFVGWLDSDESPVDEYGFSNSSLEEVFLKVTEGDEEEHPVETVEGEENEITEQDEDVEIGDVAKVNDLSSFQPNLVTSNQVRLLVWGEWQARVW